VRRKLGDRRVRPRYDVVGDLWGTIETVLEMPLLNVSPGGALIECDLPLTPESIHRLTFSFDGQQAGTQVRVRHVEPIATRDGRRMYRIGVEFVSMHPTLAGHIARCMTNGDAGLTTAVEA
jgi:hypothetical protein